MKKFIKSIISSIIVILICLGCNEECPYKEIEWENKTSQTENESSNEMKIKVQGGMEGIIKKMGKGHVSAEVDADLKRLSKEITNSSISYDKEFVSNWNSLVMDICGKFYEIQNSQLPDSLKSEIEKSYCQRVISFYELTFASNDRPIKNNASKSDTEPKVQSQENQIEITIQLPIETRGYSKIFVNGQKAKVHPDDAPKNPRILIESDSKRTQTITIITIEGDTCILNKVFSSDLSKDFPIRFSPICFKK
jgi:hypothetical protein